MSRRFNALAALIAASLVCSCALIDGVAGEETDCLDGEDNDGNGLQDCEDPACRSTRPCSVNELNDLGERCNGADEAGSAFGDLVDEGACACINDNGCDDIGQICEPTLTLIDEDAGTCVPPDCNQFDYCAAIGEDCGADGRCDFNFPTAQ
jgi:hypothetical protein